MLLFQKIDFVLDYLYIQTTELYSRYNIICSSRKCMAKMLKEINVQSNKILCLIPEEAALGTT